MKHFIEIHLPLWSPNSYEVIAFPEDETFPPVALTQLPVSAREGDIEVVLPEGDEFDGEIFVFEFDGGVWHECREDQELDMNFGLSIAV